MTTHRLGDQVFQEWFTAMSQMVWKPVLGIMLPIMLGQLSTLPQLSCPSLCLSSLGEWLISTFLSLVFCLSLPLHLILQSAPSFHLIIVIGATMIKEGIEDWRRKQQDIEVNNRLVKVHGGGKFKQTEWKNLKVGHIVKVEKDEFFPADLVLLSSSYEDAVCYVETMNLDGETNLKLKKH
ncbi:UNVERIFIED_CONTAM: Phospholipid-transporting ATPase 10 [Sesamum angustifolium]|uniref:Phospholipid-transporting ATPase 10 n=1 Tax=Sesamum angustifolium TaxID=2727405 RepID=A0AAW2M6G1_9LAMI